MGSLRQRCIPRAAALAAALLLGGCKEEQPAVPHGEAIDDHRIELPDAGPVAAGEVWDLEFTVDSLFYLLHSTEPHIRVQHVRDTAPRLIGGSDRLTQPAAFGFWRGDSIWVFDGANRQVSLFATRDGMYGRSWAPLPTAGTGEFSFVGLLLDGSALAFQRAATSAADTLSTTALVRVSVAPPVFDTLTVVQERGPLRIAGDANAGGLAQPFAAPAYALISALDGLIVVITDSVAASGESAIRVTKINLKGDTAFSTRLPYDAVRLRRSAADAVIDRLAGSTSDGDRVRQAVRVPNFLPSVTGVMEAANGSILVRREDAGKPTVRWTVFNRSGQFVADLETPSAAHITVADGTFVFGVARDQQGTAIVRYRIARSDSASAPQGTSNR